MIFRIFTASILLCASLSAFYIETIVGPENAFEFTSDEARWEKIHDTVEEEASAYIFQHKEELLTASLIYQSVPRQVLSGSTEMQLVDAFIQMIHSQFDQAFFQTHKIEERMIGDKIVTLVEEEVQIADEECVQSCYVDALIYKGENYFLFHYVMSSDENLARTAGVIVGLTALAVGILTLVGQSTGKLNGLTTVYDGNKAAAFSVGGIVAAVGVTAIALAVFGFKPSKPAILGPVNAGLEDAAEGAEEAKKAARDADKNAAAISRAPGLGAIYFQQHERQNAVDANAANTLENLVRQGVTYTRASPEVLTPEQRKKLSEEKAAVVVEAPVAHFDGEGKVDLESLGREYKAKKALLDKATTGIISRLKKRKEIASHKERIAVIEKIFNTELDHAVESVEDPDRLEEIIGNIKKYVIPALTAEQKCISSKKELLKSTKEINRIEGIINKLRAKLVA
jgi:hypothetical protein